MAGKMISPSVLILMLTNFIIVSCTQRPIIGILAQEFWEEQSSKHTITAPDSSHIVASYVKAVESSGARVVPIFVNQPKSYYKSILKSINGVVIPGGDSKLKPGHPYYDAFTTIYEIATEMNENGIYFPILGVCLGFEAFMVHTNNNNDLQTRCDCKYQNYPLEFERNFKKSLVFSRISNKALIHLQHFPTTMNNHQWCTTLENFTASLLPQQWNVLATSTNLRGLKFISVVEHKKYPFFATQFHPEKPMFEWGPELNIPHSRAAVSVNRHFYDLLTILSKGNYNRFETEKEEKEALIYNYKPIYMYRSSSSVAQVYSFPQ